ncbi:MAG: PH domain-containing protein [Proteobacteria bacterium]|nr:PH domain-containing protein [Pseudomonadota bacterium]
MSDAADTLATPADDAPAAPPARAFPDGWQPLPLRARRLFVLGNVFGLGLLALGLLVPIGLLLRDTALALPLAIAVLVLLPSWGAWLAYRQFEYTRWRVDRDGYALRRGRLWRQETFVPKSRVQHLDLQRGPIERRFGLSTLVIHTAGTRQSAVSTAGLDADDAEALRDHLARWIERDDDDA